MATTASAEDIVRKKAQELFPDSPVDQAYFMGLAKQESAFNPAAYNARGDAYGVFQFAGDMRRAYGMDTNSPLAKQLEAAGDYLKKLHKKHGGDWTKVLAEHYMGLPRFNRAQAGGTDPEIRSFYASHLPKVRANASGYANVNPGKDPREITLAAAPVPPVAPVAQVPQNVAANYSPQSFLAERFQMPALDRSVEDSRRAQMLPMLLQLLASTKRQPLVFGGGR